MMTRENLLIVFLLLGVSFQAIAQKAKTANETLEFTYMRPPAEKMDASFTTFSRNLIGGGDLSRYGVNVGSYVTNLNIQGKKHVDTGGHILFEMTIGNPVIKSNKVDKVNTKVKNKDGSESTVTEYKPSVSVDLPVHYRIVDFNNNVVFEKEFVESDNSVTVSSKGYKDQASAKKALAKNLSNNIGGKVAAVTKGISRGMSFNYGYTPIEAKEQFYSIKPKKHPLKAKFQLNVDRVKTAFSKVKPGADVAATLAAIAKPMEFFETTAKGVSNGDSKAENLKYACLYNLAKINALLHNVDIAKGHLSGLKKLGVKKGAVGDLEKAIDNIAKMIANNPEKGIYQSIDITGATPPKTVSYSMGEGAPAAAPSTMGITVPSNTTLETGKVYYNGSEKDAAFICPILKVEGSPVNLVPEKGFKIYAFTGGDYKVLEPITSLKVGDYFSYGNVKYLLEKSDRGKHHDVKVIRYESDRIINYGSNSMNRKPMFPTMRLKKKGSTDEWKFTLASDSKLKQQIKDYLSDCPSIGPNVLDKISLDDEAWMAICEYYTKSCK